MGSPQKQREDPSPIFRGAPPCRRLDFRLPASGAEMIETAIVFSPPSLGTIGLGGHSKLYKSPSGDTFHLTWIVAPGSQVQVTPVAPPRSQGEAWRRASQQHHAGKKGVSGRRWGRGQGRRDPLGSCSAVVCTPFARAEQTR